MEDRYTIKFNLHHPKQSFFAVYDGHAGSRASEEASQYFWSNFSFHLAQLEKRRDPKPEDFELAFKVAIKSWDDTFLAFAEKRNFRDGSTAIMALQTPQDFLHVANVGDSRAVLGSGGRAIGLSTDHKPYHYNEQVRILKAGGFVFQGRVLARNPPLVGLAVSRALGDKDFKTLLRTASHLDLVSSEPDVVHWKLTPEDHFMVLASDGLFDVLSNPATVALVYQQLALVGWPHKFKGNPQELASRIADQLVARALSLNTEDNVCAVLVLFAPSPT
jgi:protein phosphatase 2C family protein 2/3